jgi:hypothetical protein
MNDQNVTLSLNLVNGVLQYLGTRPYQEVFPLVQEIQAVVIPQLKVPEAPEMTE